MDNPLSPLLADMFMDNIEQVIHKYPCSKNMTYWYMYVDDILVCLCYVMLFLL